jgi:chemotaxis protein methyltransferase CheR
VARLVDSLGPGGVLLTGTADAVLPCLAEHEGLEPLAPGLYRKAVARPAQKRPRVLPLRPSTKQAARPMGGVATRMSDPVDMVRLECQTREAVRQGRQAEAMRLAGQWLELAPAAAAPKLLLARLHADRGALSEAFLWADRAINSDKAEPGAHCLRASILIEMGQRVEAAKALNRALYLAPDFVPAHYGLGVLALGEGKESRARRHFDNALAILSERAPQATVAELDGVSVRTLTDAIRSLRDSRLVGVAS